MGRAGVRLWSMGRNGLVAYARSVFVMLRKRWNGNNQQCGQCKMSRFHRNLRMPAGEYSESPLFACFGGSSATTLDATRNRNASCASKKKLQRQFLLKNVKV
jgi:hypothetical protein